MWCVCVCEKHVQLLILRHNMLLKIRITFNLYLTLAYRLCGYSLKFNKGKRVAYQDGDSYWTANEPENIVVIIGGPADEIFK